MFFFKNQKHAFSRVKIKKFRNSNFKFVFLYLFFIVKGGFVPIFTKNIDISAPWNFLQMKTLMRVRCKHRNFWFGLLKSCLNFGYLTCSVRSKKKFHTPPYWTVHTYIVLILPLISWLVRVSTFTRKFQLISRSLVVSFIHSHIFHNILMGPVDQRQEF